MAWQNANQFGKTGLIAFTGTCFNDWMFRVDFVSKKSSKIF